ncbi:MAG: hypothetical protein LAO23_10640 [Acidobacteriia bacterium]|nr:hypothetical protein [Terriglobia bacterium]
MFSKTIAIGGARVTLVLSSIVLLGQSIPAGPSSSSLLEFPVIMLQKVTAGTTPVRTKVQAKLALATLVGRVVVPQGAILSGEVTESVPKSATNASRLGIRMDSAQWKNGSVTIRVYLTAWYYPVTPPLQDLSTDPRDDVAIRPRRRRGGVNSPYPNSAPGRGTGPDLAPAPPSPEQSISKHRVLMKNVESARNHDGAITLISKSGNIKLDKETAYVLAGNLLPAN